MLGCAHWWKSGFRFRYNERQSKDCFKHGLKLIINHIVWVFIYKFVWFFPWWVLGYMTMSLSFWITNYYSSVTDKGCDSCFNRGLKKINLIFFCKGMELSGICSERRISHFHSLNMDNFNLGLLLLLYSLPFSYNLYCYLLPVFTRSLFYNPYLYTFHYSYSQLIIFTHVLL